MLNPASIDFLIIYIIQACAVICIGINTMQKYPRYRVFMVISFACMAALLGFFAWGIVQDSLTANRSGNYNDGTFAAIFSLFGPMLASLFSITLYFTLIGLCNIHRLRRPRI